jgi:hypothetical protein
MVSNGGDASQAAEEREAIHNRKGQVLSVLAKYVSHEHFVSSNPGSQAESSRS